MKRDPIKTARNKADKLFKQACVQKYGSSCEVCGLPASQVHHFFPKGMSSKLRYDLDNGVVICAGCHLKHHMGNPVIHSTIIDNRGRKWYNKLRLKRELIKTNLTWYKENIKRLESYISN